ncbi:hypothetical protein [Viridibacillus arvi]|uniref:hypothetical protein n=1 Tax=Viridibacillus arvi TaxID=263475 RepID=UPI003D2D5D2D
MFNITNEQDIQFLMDTGGQKVLIDAVETVALITNAELGEVECRHIHTLEPVTQGSYIKVNEETYLNVTENTTMRNNKYKTKIQHCNYVIEVAGEIEEVLMRDKDGNIVYDKFGDEVYIQVQGDSISVPSIVKEDKSFSINGTQLLVANYQINVTVKDNEVNLTKFAVNNAFKLMDEEWKVRNHNRTRKGLLILICEKQ